MGTEYSEFFKAAAKIVDELPETLGQLDKWISKVEASNLIESPESGPPLESAESLRDGLVSVLESVENGTILSDVEQGNDVNRLFVGLESTTNSLNMLASALDSIPSVEVAGNSKKVIETAEVAEAFLVSVEPSPTP